MVLNLEHGTKSCPDNWLLLCGSFSLQAQNQKNDIHEYRSREPLRPCNNAQFSHQLLWQCRCETSCQRIAQCKNLYKRTQHCWAQHVASVCMEPQQCSHLLALVAYSLKPVKLLGPYKRTQHCWPTTRKNVVTCCGPFAWALTWVVS